VGLGLCHSTPRPFLDSDLDLACGYVRPPRCINIVLALLRLYCWFAARYSCLSVAFQQPRCGCRAAKHPSDRSFLRTLLPSSHHAISFSLSSAKERNLHARIQAGARNVHSLHRRRPVPLFRGRGLCFFACCWFLSRQRATNRCAPLDSPFLISGLCDDGRLVIDVTQAKKYRVCTVRCIGKMSWGKEKKGKRN
jgi:hypothetical protein